MIRLFCFQLHSVLYCSFQRHATYITITINGTKEEIEFQDNGDILSDELVEIYQNLSYIVQLTILSKTKQYVHNRQK